MKKRLFVLGLAILFAASSGFTALAANPAAQTSPAAASAAQPTERLIGSGSSHVTLPEPSGPAVVDSQDALQTALSDGKKDIRLAAGEYSCTFDSAASGVHITASDGATLTLSDACTASNLHIDVESGGTVKECKNIGAGNTVTADPGACLSPEESAVDLVGAESGNNKPCIGLSSGSVTVRGTGTDADYDISIDGKATIQYSKTSSAVGSLMIISGRTLSLKGEITVEPRSGDSAPLIVQTGGEVVLESGGTLTLTVDKSVHITGGKMTVANKNDVTGGKYIDLDSGGTIVDLNGNPIDFNVATSLAVAAAGITAPATGAMPDTAAVVDSGAGYTAGTVTWAGQLAADGSFAYDTVYTASITLTTKYDRFAENVTGTVNGQTAAVNRKSDTEVTLSYSFAKTGKQIYNITVHSGGNGTAIAAPSSAAQGETIALTANPDGGYHFKEWQVISGSVVISGNQFTMPAENVTVKALFGKNSSSGGGSYTAPDPKNSYTATGDRISQSVSRYDLQWMINSGKSLTLSCDKASMTFEPAALKAILAEVPATAGNITFAAAPADLSAFPDAAALIGSRPVYDFTVSYKDGSGKTVPVTVNFPAGQTAVTLNYTPAAGEVTGSLFMVYVDEKGAVTWLDKSRYDSGKVLADAPHFSAYGVACKAPAPVFTDTANHWAKADIEFVAARGLLTGTGDKTFSPDATMTRGMFVTALGRLAGISPADYKTRSFTDVQADAYYAAYVEWAAQKGIVNGTGEGLFSPDAPVTREQMAVMMAGYAGQLGYSVPAPLAEAAFTDNASISAWAAKEVGAMQRAGIVKGKEGSRFAPQEGATRAEVSTVLHRFVEIVIDPATAQGWTKNDSGH